MSRTRFSRRRFVRGALAAGLALGIGMSRSEVARASTFTSAASGASMGGYVTCVAKHPSTNGRAFLGGDTWDSLFETTDGGKTWSPQMNGLTAHPYVRSLLYGDPAVSDGCYVAIGGLSNSSAVGDILWCPGDGTATKLTNGTVQFGNWSGLNGSVGSAQTLTGSDAPRGVGRLLARVTSGGSEYLFAAAWDGIYRHKSGDAWTTWTRIWQYNSTFAAQGIVIKAIFFDAATTPNLVVCEFSNTTTMGRVWYLPTPLTLAAGAYSGITGASAPPLADVNGADSMNGGCIVQDVFMGTSSPVLIYAGQTSMWVGQADVSVSGSGLALTSGNFADVSPDPTDTTGQTWVAILATPPATGTNNTHLRKSTWLTTYSGGVSTVQTDLYNTTIPFWLLPDTTGSNKYLHKPGDSGFNGSVIEVDAAGNLYSAQRGGLYVTTDLGVHWYAIAGVNGGVDSTLGEKTISSVRTIVVSDTDYGFALLTNGGVNTAQSDTNPGATLQSGLSHNGYQVVAPTSSAPAKFKTTADGMDHADANFQRLVVTPSALYVDTTTNVAYVTHAGGIVTVQV